MAQLFGTDNVSASNADSPTFADTADPPEPGATAPTIALATDGADAVAAGAAGAAPAPAEPQLIAPVAHAELTIPGEIVAPEACSKVETIGGGV